MDVFALPTSFGKLRSKIDDIQSNVDEDGGQVEGRWQMKIAMECNEDILTVRLSGDLDTESDAVLEKHLPVCG